MSGYHDTARRLRMLILDHILVIVLMLMVATIFSVLLIGGHGEHGGRPDSQLERSLSREP